MSRNAASSGGLAVAVIWAELLPLLWGSAAMNTAINKIKEHVIPFPPGEAQGNRCLEAWGSLWGEKYPQTNTEEKTMEKSESEQEIN